MKSVQIDYGFSSIAIGAICVYACKIRVKDAALPRFPKEIKVERRSDKFQIISFELTDQKRATTLYKKIGVALKAHAEKKLTQKYLWVDNL